MADLLNEAATERLHAEMRRRLREYSIILDHRVHCATWNVSSKKLDADTDLSDWLIVKGEPMPAIYAISFQEIVDLNAMNVVWDGSESDKMAYYWQQKILMTLESTGTPYTVVGEKHLVGLCLFVIVKDALTPQINDVRMESAGIGMMGIGGNKAGIAVRLKLSETTICFVASHLRHGQHEVVGRNQDVKSIFDRIVLSPVHERPHEKMAACREWAFADYSRALAISSHDVIFWLGDLNYRISDEVSKELVYDTCIRTKLFDRIRHYDQLSIERMQQKVFPFFEEGKLNFPPTYKYQRGTCEYDEKRLPAWCDRVLWKDCDGFPGSVRQVKYWCVQEICTSDHKPVGALFDVSTLLPDMDEEYDIYEALLRQFRVVNEVLPVAEIGEASVFVDVSTSSSVASGSESPSKPITQPNTNPHTPPQAPPFTSPGPSAGKKTGSPTNLSKESPHGARWWEHKKRPTSPQRGTATSAEGTMMYDKAYDRTSKFVSSSPFASPGARKMGGGLQVVSGHAMDGTQENGAGEMMHTDNGLGEAPQSPPPSIDALDHLPDQPHQPHLPHLPIDTNAAKPAEVVDASDAITHSTAGTCTSDDTSSPRSNMHDDGDNEGVSCAHKARSYVPLSSQARLGRVRTRRRGDKLPFDELGHDLDDVDTGDGDEHNTCGDNDIKITNACDACDAEEEPMQTEEVHMDTEDVHMSDMNMGMNTEENVVENNKHTDMQTDIHADMQTDTQTLIQTDMQTDMQTLIQTEEVLSAEINTEVDQSPAFVCDTQTLRT